MSCVWGGGFRPAAPLRVDDQVVGERVEVPAALVLDNDDVLDAKAPTVRDDQRRLVGEGHAGLEWSFVLGGEERPLVDVLADSVTHAVAEVLAEAVVLDRRPAGGVHLLCACPG